MRADAAPFARASSVGIAHFLLLPLRSAAASSSSKQESRRRAESSESSGSESESESESGRDAEKHGKRKHGSDEGVEHKRSRKEQRKRDKKSKRKKEKKKKKDKKKVRRRSEPVQLSKFINSDSDEGVERSVISGKRIKRKLDKTEQDKVLALPAGMYQARCTSPRQHRLAGDKMLNEWTRECCRLTTPTAHNYSHFSTSPSNQLRDRPEASYQTMI